MGQVIRLAAFRKWRNSRDVPAAMSTGVKAVRRSRPGKDRGVIAIVKPAGERTTR
jgi:hypothetical protein